MAIRTVETDVACATTLARLDKSVTVARTQDNTLLLNIPRSIDELDAATAGAKKEPSILERLFNWVS